MSEVSASEGGGGGGTVRREGSSPRRLGNDAYRRGDYLQAISCYTSAIGSRDGSLHLLYSNRSASFLAVSHFESALDDANSVILQKPLWSKGHFRRGNALLALSRFDEAVLSFDEACSLEPDNDELRSRRDAARAALAEAQQANDSSTQLEVHDDDGDGDGDNHNSLETNTNGKTSTAKKNALPKSPRSASSNAAAQRLNASPNHQGRSTTSAMPASSSQPPEVAKAKPPPVKTARSPSSPSTSSRDSSSSPKGTSRGASRDSSPKSSSPNHSNQGGDSHSQQQQQQQQQQPRKKDNKNSSGLAAGFLSQPKKATKQVWQAKKTTASPPQKEEPTTIATTNARIPAFDVSKLLADGEKCTVKLVRAGAVDDRDRIVPPWLKDTKRQGPPNFGATAEQLSAMEHGLALIKGGQLAAAEGILQPLCASVPHHPHPFFFLGFTMQGRGALTEACGCYAHALARQPFLIAARTNLVLALTALERIDEAGSHAINACRHEPENAKRFFEAGVVMSKLGKQAEASHYYQQALVLDPKFVEAYVNNDAALLAAGGTVWCRAFARCARHHLQGKFWCNEWQRPPHFVNGLTSRPFWDAATMALCRDLEENFAAIRDEALAALSQSATWGNVGTRSTHDASLVASGTWREYPLLCGDQAGTSYAANRAACPVTMRLLESHPCALLCAKNGVGESLFSRLTPGSKLRPHCGSTNTRLTCHLGLRVPAGCTLMVGGVSRGWEEGRCVVFDDSFEHEVSHHGPVGDTSVDRVVLLVNFWHPDYDMKNWNQPLDMSSVRGESAYNVA
ncbi:aspartate beta-hydroxylase [Pycnococcus provasolii]